MPIIPLFSCFYLLLFINYLFRCSIINGLQSCSCFRASLSLSWKKDQTSPVSLWTIFELFIIYIFMLFISQNFIKNYEDYKGIVIGNSEKKARKWCMKKVFCERCSQIAFPLLLSDVEWWILPFPCGSQEFQVHFVCKTNRKHYCYRYEGTKWLFRRWWLRWRHRWPFTAVTSVSNWGMSWFLIIH